MRFNREEIRADICYHEAAHAVFAYHARLPIRRVFVTEELEAICVTYRLPKPYPRQGVELAAVYLAGEHALWRRRGQPRPRVTFDDFAVGAEVEAKGFADGLDAYAGDYAGALELVQLAANDPGNPWGGIEGCYEAACRIAASNVVRWWDEISAVAERLREVGCLEGDECIALIEGAARGE